MLSHNLDWKALAEDTSAARVRCVVVQAVTKNMFRVRCSRQLQKRICAALALGSLFCGAALAQTVSASYAPGLDFSKYHTYKWIDVQHPVPSVDKQIKQSVDSQLAAHGLVMANDNADLSIAYQVAIEQEQKWQAYEDWSDTSFGGQRFPQHKLVTITVGTLVVDMYDTSGKALVWSGRATKALDPSSSQTDRLKNLDKAVKKLLAAFPPK